MNKKQQYDKFVRMAEQRQALVDDMELKVLRELGLTEPKTSMQAYRLKQKFEHDELYKQRGNSRNLFIQLAIMYGIGALLEEDE